MEPSRIESKRSHQWFFDDSEQELFPTKRQAVHTLDTNQIPGISNASVPLWENTSHFQPVPNQFIDRLLGSDRARSANIIDTHNSHLGGGEGLNIRRDHIDEQRDNNASVDLSMEVADTYPKYGGIRKVKINQVEDSVNSFGHMYSRGHGHMSSAGSSFQKGDDSSLSGHHAYVENNSISFGGVDGEPGAPLAAEGDHFNLMRNQASVRVSESVGKEELIAKAKAVVSVAQDSNLRDRSISKNKSESKKEAPNSFPSNVRSLISTGMLDGVPIKYVSLSRQELCGIIKGSGYLCGCQSCNFSKVLNAYEFERHAGCKTKHPNNHIYFENGKTIYQIVQELRRTPGSKLFDTMETVFGAPINQNSFRIWKESFQAATRELQRIYGKDELNV